MKKSNDDEFAAANRWADRAALSMIKTGIDPAVAAGTLIEKGLAIWGSHSGRHDEAHVILRSFLNEVEAWPKT